MKTITIHTTGDPTQRRIKSGDFDYYCPAHLVLPGDPYDRQGKIIIGDVAYRKHLHRAKLTDHSHGIKSDVLNQVDRLVKETGYDRTSLIEMIIEQLNHEV
jgi:hypothetical protein